MTKDAWPKLTRACVPRTDGTVNGTGHIQVCIPVELSPHKGGRELSAPLPTTTTKLRRGRARSRRKKRVLQVVLDARQTSLRSLRLVSVRS